MRLLLYGNAGLGLWKTHFYEKKDDTISSFSHACRNLAGSFIRKRLKASYTIEAAYVMAILFLSLSVMILSAYRVHDKTTGAMAVQESVEKLRHMEDREKDHDVKVKTVYLRDEYEIQTKAAGKNIIGKGKGASWKLEIQTKRYEPEGFLRLFSIAEEGMLNNRE